MPLHSLAQLLHHIEPITVLNQTLHHLMLSQHLHEPVHCVRLRILKDLLNDIGGEFLDRQLHQMRLKLLKDPLAVTEWPVLY